MTRIHWMIMCIGYIVGSVTERAVHQPTMLNCISAVAIVLMIFPMCWAVTVVFAPKRSPAKYVP